MIGRASLRRLAGVPMPTPSPVPSPIPAADMPALPPGWVWTTVGEIAPVNQRNSTLRELPDTTEVTFVPMAAVDAESGSIQKPESRLLGQVRKGFTSFSEGDILFAKITSCMENGKVAIARGLINQLGFGSTEFHTLRPSRSVIAEWLFYYVRQQSFRDEAELSFSGTAGQLRVPTKFLDNHPFPLPPLAEQHRIVAAIETQLTRLDAGVASLKAAKAKLKRYRASVLKAACEGRLVAQDANDEPADVLLRRILGDRGQGIGKRRATELAAPDTTGLPELPTGWCWATAEQLCDFITKGTTPSADKLYESIGDVPYIKVYNLTHQGMLDFSIRPTFIDKKTHLQELARSRVFPGDVLMNIVGPPLGKVSIVPSTHPEWNINQAIAIFRPLSGFDRKYLSLCLLTDSILNWAVRRAKATAGQFNLTLEICRDLPIPLPPLAEQRRIVAEVERLLSVVTALEATVTANLKRAERLRQSILKRAFEGKLVAQEAR